MTAIHSALYEYIQSLWIVDTHEHLESASEHRPDPDVLKEYLLHYFCRDMVSAGLSQADLDRACDPNRSVMERFLLLEPYWEAARLTGYGQALDICARDLYGLPRIDRTTIEALNDAFIQGLTLDRYQRVLKDKSRIAVSVNCMGNEHNGDRRFFAFVHHVDRWICTNFNEITQLQERSGIPIRTFQDYLDAVIWDLEEGYSKGIVGLKCSIAYQRSLYFPKPKPGKAEGQFDAALAAWRLHLGSGGRVAIGTEFENAVFHRILRWAEDKGVVIQVHTGLQEGNGNLLTNSDPTLLNNLFLSYPDLRFDLFHIGYPYFFQTAALAKVQPNVFIDMCWAHIISPNASRLALHEFLDAVPYNKIAAFGGDYLFIDGVYAHQKMARMNVTRVLSEKMAREEMDLDMAKAVARAVLADNPARLFGIGQYLEQAQ